MSMYFYEKPLSELQDEEWEQICMKCGKCCMCKYSEKDMIYFSNQMCRFFDLKKGRCSCYSQRFEITGGECKKVSVDLLEHHLELLPPSCAYRRLYEGRGLPEYHPLLTGDIKSVIKAGKTVKSLPVFSEDDEEKAVQKLYKTAIRCKMSLPEIRKKIQQIHEKFSLHWLESYPLHSCKKPTV